MGFSSPKPSLLQWKTFFHHGIFVILVGIMSSNLVVEAKMPKEYCLELMTEDQQNMVRDDFAERVFFGVLSDILEVYAFEGTSRCYGQYDVQGLRGTVLRRNSDQIKLNSYDKFLPLWQDLPKSIQKKFVRVACRYSNNQNKSVLEFCNAFANGNENASNVPTIASIPFDELFKKEEVLEEVEGYYDIMTNLAFAVGEDLCDRIIDNAWDDLVQIVLSTLEQHELMIPLNNGVVCQTPPNEGTEKDETTSTTTDTTTTNDKNSLTDAMDANNKASSSSGSDTTSNSDYFHVMTVVFDIRVDTNTLLQMQPNELQGALANQISKRVASVLTPSSSSSRRATLRALKEAGGRTTEASESKATILEQHVRGALKEVGGRDLASGETLGELEKVEVALMEKDCTPVAEDGSNISCFEVMGIVHFVLVSEQEANIDEIESQMQDAVKDGQTEGAYFSDGTIEGLKGLPGGTNNVLAVESATEKQGKKINRKAAFGGAIGAFLGFIVFGLAAIMLAKSQRRRRQREQQADSDLYLEETASEVDVMDMSFSQKSEKSSIFGSFGTIKKASTKSKLPSIPGSPSSGGQRTEPNTPERDDEELDDVAVYETNKKAPTSSFLSGLVSGLASKKLSPPKGPDSNEEEDPNAPGLQETSSKEEKTGNIFGSPFSKASRQLRNTNNKAASPYKSLDVETSEPSPKSSKKSPKRTFFSWGGSKSASDAASVKSGTSTVSEGSLSQLHRYLWGPSKEPVQDWNTLTKVDSTGVDHVETVLESVDEQQHALNDSTARNLRKMNWTTTPSFDNEAGGSFDEREQQAKQPIIAPSPKPYARRKSSKVGQVSNMLDESLANIKLPSDDSSKDKTEENHGGVPAVEEATKTPKTPKSGKGFKSILKGKTKKGTSNDEDKKEETAETIAHDAKAEPTSATSSEKAAAADEAKQVNDKVKTEQGNASSKNDVNETAEVKAAVAAKKDNEQTHTNLPSSGLIGDMLMDTFSTLVKGGKKNDIDTKKNAELTSSQHDSITSMDDSPWTAVIDEASGNIYYYNEDTEETTWDKPADFPDNETIKPMVYPAKPNQDNEKKTVSSDKNKNDEKDTALPVKEAKKETNNEADDNEGSITSKSGDAKNNNVEPTSTESTKDKKSKKKSLFHKKNKNRASSEDKNSDEGKKEESKSDEKNKSNEVDAEVKDEPNTDTTENNEPAAVKRTWQAVIDKASGQTYYFDTETLQTTWEKPIGFDELVPGSALHYDEDDYDDDDDDESSCDSQSEGSSLHADRKRGGKAKMGKRKDLLDLVTKQVIEENPNTTVKK